MSRHAMKEKGVKFLGFNFTLEDQRLFDDVRVLRYQKGVSDHLETMTDTFKALLREECARLAAR